MEIISFTNSNHDILTAITDNNGTIINLSDIIKNILITSILNNESFFVHPTLQYYFSSNLDKNDGANSVPTRILTLLKKDQLAILFKQSLSCGIFPSIFKTIKIIPM